MTTNQNPDDFPSLSVDKEDRDAYFRGRSKTTPTSSTSASSTSTLGSPSSSTTSVSAEKPRSSGGGWFATLLALIACAGSGWLFYQNQLNMQQLQNAQSRIVELENQLSATGEEMGESTVALRANVKQLATKTEQLWEQMDKLWASAWRRNQTEIKELKKLTEGQYSDARKVREGLQSSNKQLQTEMASLVESLNQQRQEAGLLLTSLNDLQDKQGSQYQRSVKAEERLVALEQGIRLVAQRLEALEKWRKNQQDNQLTAPKPKPVSQSVGAAGPQ